MMPKKKRASRPRAKDRDSRPGSQAWQTLAAKYPGRPALAEEAVYALPSALIELIYRKVPGVLTADDAEFERDLTEASPSGFFRGHPIDYAPLGFALPSIGEADEKVRESTARIRQMLVDDALNRGAPRSLVEEIFSATAQEREIVRETSWGYAGWLATNSEFRRELQALRSQQGDATHDVDLPSMPFTFAGRSHDARPDEFYKLWLPFFQRWGIDKMATWDLPVPLRPELSTPSLYDMAQAGPAGVVVFMPWHLLRLRSFDIYAMADRAQLFRLPSGVAPWLNPREKHWGVKRYHAMLQMLVYLELGLKRRYGERLHRTTKKLDDALSRFLGLDVDSVRKVRQRMAKRLAEPLD
jgi:hypothetical protein